MNGNRPLALVAEETPLGRWALTRLLEAGGFDVHAAADWREASVFLANAEFSLAVVDVASGRTNVADNVRCFQHYHRGTNIVLLVEDGMAQDIRSLCGPGVFVVSKPIDLAEIGRIARTDPSADRDAEGAA